jgi:hypothetical protein
MWDPSWLRTKSFWLETGLFFVFMALIVIVAIVKPTMPAVQKAPTPTAPPALIYYYSDTDPLSATTWIRRSTTNDVNETTNIAVIQHADGTQPTGSLSPDGSQIALLVVEEGASDTTDGKLWLLHTDGNYFQRASDEPCSWFAWRQDGQALALLTQSKKTPASGMESRLIKLNLVTGETSVIFEDNTILDLNPLGWSSGGAEFVVMVLESPGIWSVASINLETGARVDRFSLPGTDLLRNAWLSPSGAYLLLDLIRANEAILMLSTLDGGQQVKIASIGVGLFTTPLPFTAVWSPDGQRILMNQPSAGQIATTWKTYELKGVAGTPINLGVVEPDHFLRPLAWSPDGNWLAMEEFPFPYSHLYIKEISADDRLRLPFTNIGDQAGWLGWSPIP